MFRCSEYSVLIHGVPITQNSETSEHLEKIARDVIVNKLRFPSEKLKEATFCNIHRLPSRKDTTQSNGTSSTKASLIVIKH